jgi:D-inositol-3-phosphate glycosyltransferase
MELSGFSSVPPEGIYGMTVFLRRFVEALLRHGDFDELHFFYSGSAPQADQGGLLFSDPRIRLLPVTRFESETSRHTYHAFHNLWSPDIGPWTDLRNRLSAVNFPITGLTHTISYQSFLPRVLGTMLLGPRPWDSIICTTESARVVMREWVTHLQTSFREDKQIDLAFDARLDVIPLGLDTEAFQPGNKAELRSRLGLPADEVLALYFGRFSHYDKMDLFPLLLAFKKVLDDCGQKVSLVLAGSESFHKYSERVRQFAAQLGIADRVILRIDVPSADVAAYYAASDLFVSPSDSLQETFGQSIVEAMSSGLPVVCSDWDGYKELVVHEETGFRVPSYWMDCDRMVADYSSVSEWLVDHFLIAQAVAVDVPAMAAAMTRLVRDEGLRRTWGANARRRAQALFDWRRVIAQHLELWQTLHQQAAAAPHTPAAKSWFRPDYCKTFQHYPTQMLSSSTRIVRGSSHEISFYSEMEEILTKDVLHFVMHSTANASTVGDLEAATFSALGVPADVFRNHLLWLIKYDHLRLERLS